jgi:hypothetical protein
MFAHALNNVCGVIGKNDKLVNQLISNGKKIFKKSPNRINTFRELYPEIPLPPEPILTRWCSWLKAVDYYVKYFDEFSDVINHLDINDSTFIVETQEIIKKISLKNDLVFIN